LHRSALLLETMISGYGGGGCLALTVSGAMTPT
jgi:hypothetical protein